jgi:hypothetical protein
MISQNQIKGTYGNNLTDDINYLLQNTGGNKGLVYRDINDMISLQPKEILKKNYSLGDKSILITGVYIISKSEIPFTFNIFDKENDGFKIYSLENVTNIADNLYLPYKDYDNGNNLHIEVSNIASSLQNVVSFRIVGLELEV